MDSIIKKKLIPRFNKSLKLSERIDFKNLIILFSLIKKTFLLTIFFFQYLIYFYMAIYSELYLVE